MTNVHLVLLGLLCTEPMHGYEIKHVIEAHMNDWTDIKFGSIYFSLSRLEEQGDIEVLEQTREGNRPDRRVYRITEQGRKNYLRMLKDLWTDPKRPLYALDIALFFIDSLPREEVQTLIEGQIGRLEQSLRYLSGHRAQTLATEHVPAQAGYIILHTHKHMQAELEFLREVLDHLDELY